MRQETKVWRHNKGATLVQDIISMLLLIHS